MGNDKKNLRRERGNSLSNRDTKADRAKHIPGMENGEEGGGGRLTRECAWAVTNYDLGGGKTLVANGSGGTMGSWEAIKGWLTEAGPVGG